MIMPPGFCFFDDDDSIGATGTYVLKDDLEGAKENTKEAIDKKLNEFRDEFRREIREEIRETMMEKSKRPRDDEDCPASPSKKVNLENVVSDEGEK